MVRRWARKRLKELVSKPLLRKEISLNKRGGGKKGIRVKRKRQVPC